MAVIRNNKKDVSGNYMSDTNCIIIQTASDRRPVVVFLVIFLTGNAHFEMCFLFY